MQNSLLFVQAYSGWNDAFMKCLAQRVEEADLLEAEIVWAAHDSNLNAILSNPILASLSDAPGFALYLGIDGHSLFQETPQDETTDHRGDLEARAPSLSPFGYTRLPVPDGRKGYDPRRLADGGQPTWSDATTNTWPLLGATIELISRLEVLLESGGGGGIIGIGPVGEGKSMGLRQAAVSISQSQPDVTVLWREPGAPSITREWLTQVRDDYGRVVICVDDADLVASDLVVARDIWARQGSEISLMLASNDRLWWPQGVKLKSAVDDVLFHGISESEALEICRAWAKAGLLSDAPSGGQSHTLVQQYASRLSASTTLMVESSSPTLFGAVLDVRFGAGLKHRVEELLTRLSQTKLRSQDAISVGDIFGAICVLQDVLDKYGVLRKGASRSLIAAMANLAGEFVDGKVLELLGREAAITYAGSRVYSRHPAIARSAVEYLRRTSRMEGICRLLGLAGGRLRDAADLPEEDYRTAYLLTLSLSAKDEAVAAATGAIEGAPGLLEPRVTLMRVLRRFDLALADRYASALRLKLRDYRDLGSAIRAFLNEHSQIARNGGEAYLSLGLAALALHDGVGYALDDRRAGYALTSVAKAALDVRQQSQASAGEVPEIAYLLMERVAGADAAEEHLRTARARMAPIGPSLRALSSEVLCRTLGPALNPPARSAAEALGGNVILGESITLNDLQRLALGRSRERR
jgi:hypothetical protein